MKKHVWKVVLLLLLAVAAGVGVQQILWRHRVANEYQRINTELIDAHRFEEAAAQLDKLLSEAPPEMKSDLRQALVVCYKALGRDPGRPFRESAAWLRKAQALDPASITPEEQRLMNLGEQMPGPP